MSSLIIEAIDNDWVDVADTKSSNSCVSETQDWCDVSEYNPMLLAEKLNLNNSAQTEEYLKSNINKKPIVNIETSAAVLTVQMLVELSKLNGIDDILVPQIIMAEEAKNDIYCSTESITVEQNQFKIQNCLKCRYVY